MLRPRRLPRSGARTGHSARVALRARVIGFLIGTRREDAVWVPRVGAPIAPAGRRLASPSARAELRLQGLQRLRAPARRPAAERLPAETASTAFTHAAEPVTTVNAPGRVADACKRALQTLHRWPAAPGRECRCRHPGPAHERDHRWSSSPSSNRGWSTSAPAQRRRMLPSAKAAGARRRGPLPATETPRQWNSRRPRRGGTGAASSSSWYFVPPWSPHQPRERRMVISSPPTGQA